MGEYEVVDRLCEVSNHLLEIVRKQAEVIAQCEISEELAKELATMRSDADTELEIIEMRLRNRR